MPKVTPKVTQFTFKLVDERERPLTAKAAKDMVLAALIAGLDPGCSIKGLKPEVENRQ